MRHRSTLLFLMAALIAAAGNAPAHADKIVDPTTVAPEFRDAAEMRHAEQVKLIECNNAARIAKIARRDMAKYVADCFDKDADKPQ